MKDLPRFGFILMLVTVFAASSLAWINKITRPRIEAIEKENFEAGLKLVLSGPDDRIIEPVFNENGDIKYYIGYFSPEKDTIIGYALEAVNRGYSSDIRMLVGVNETGRILAVNILSQNETPGLGTKCEEIRYGESKPWWPEQFVNKQGQDIAVAPDGGSIESISGATITARAITDGLAQSVRKFLNDKKTSAQAEMLNQ